jgi:hypothetical protein
MELNNIQSLNGEWKRRSYYKPSIEEMVSISTCEWDYDKEFREKMASKGITGHVGLEQSIGMIAAALRWELDKITIESVEPVIAKKDK